MVWRLEGDDLVEQAGRRERRLPLSDLLAFRIAPPGRGRQRAVWLRFAHARVTILSHSWSGPGRYEDRTDSFAPLVRTLAARAADLAPAARFSAAGVEAQEAFVWAMALLGGGAAALLLFSLMAGAAALGVALAARLVFVLILMFAVTPWFRPRSPRLDPRAIPPGLLPQA